MYSYYDAFINIYYILREPKMMCRFFVYLIMYTYFDMSEKNICYLYTFWLFNFFSRKLAYAYVVYWESPDPNDMTSNGIKFGNLKTVLLNSKI